MKNKAFKNALLVLLALVLCLSSLNGCRPSQEDQNQPTQPDAKPEFMQLLGFDSYEEVTGAKIAMGNTLGKMGINTDPAYITQGAGSLMVQPQGDYSLPKLHPFLKLDFLNTTCATCDFSEFSSISFDVYNASKEQVLIQAGVNVGKDDGNYVATVKQTYTLEPESWTTCTYDLSAMAGFPIYDFANVRYLVIDFLTHKQSREDQVATLYIDNLIGTYFKEGQEPETVSIDLFEGLDFETPGHELLFTGQGKDNDAVIDRLAYAQQDIPALENGGEYALRISHDTNFWPTFRINFGQELPANTVISFMAYARIDGESVYNQSIFEFTGGGEATIQFLCDEWIKLDFTLKMAASYVDLFWNYDRAQITSDSAIGEVYIDNMIAMEPVPPVEPEGSFWDGLGFEIPGNAAYFVGQKIEGDERRDATIERIPYADTDIPKLDSGEEYALRLSHNSNFWPTFRINFGEVLPAGTELTFMAYARITEGTSVYNQSIFEFSAGGEATEQFKCDQWTELTIKLTTGAEYVDLFWNYDRAQITSEKAAAEVYIDNIRAIPGEPPITPVGDIFEGLDFEILGNVGFFTNPDDPAEAYRYAIFDRVRYADANLTMPENGGEYALRLTTEESYWPVFRLNFGRTLTAGTQITFDAYTRDIANSATASVTIYEYMSGGEATAQYTYNSWHKLTVTLQNDCSYLDLVCTMDRWDLTSNSTLVEVYIDNLKAIDPANQPKPTGDFYEGIGFEEAGNELYFKPVGGENTWRDATLKVVGYQQAGVTAPTDGGKNALQLTCAASLWPVFRVEFGQTLPAGTAITFDAFARDLTDPDKNTVFVFEYLTGGDASAQFYYNSWGKVTVTLTEDASYLELVCTLNRWDENDTSSNIEVYLDNFKAVDPNDKPQPVGDFAEGVGFEKEGNDLYFTAVGGDNAWRDATLEVVDYEQAGVTAPKNGGKKALKLTSSASLWPVFRMNFGKVLPAGTAITFDAFARDLTDPDKNTVFVFEYLTGGDASAQFYYNSWGKVTVTLTEDASYLELVCTLNRWDENDTPSNLEVYLDNFKLVDAEDQPQPVGDFYKGIGFERAGNELYFGAVGGDNAWRDATLEVVSYQAAGMSAPAKGGKNVLKLTCAASQWPVFRISFGKTLPAGTVITFDAHTRDLTDPTKTSVSIFEYVAGGEATAQYYFGRWNTLSVTLNSNSDHIDLMCNMDRWNETTGSNYEVYMDNFKAFEPDGESDPTEPTEPEPTKPLDAEGFLDGLDFEQAEDLDYFSAVGGDDAWRDATLKVANYEKAGIAAPENGGKNGLKVTCAASQWPVFKLSFGKTLPAGTVITLDAYTRDLTDDEKVSVSIFEYVAGGEATAQYYFGYWTNLSVTLASDCDHIDLMCNMDRWNETTGANYEVYLDNIKVLDPNDKPQPVGDFLAGIGFEQEGNELYFGPVGGENAWRDATLEVVSYQEAGIAAPENGGKNGLKVTCAASQWPVFKLSFGKTLPAGTVISFDAYSQDLTDLTKNTVSIFEYVAGGEATVQYYFGAWNTLKITLTSSCDHIELMCNMDRWNESDASNYQVYLDNFKATVPAAAVGDILEGYGFEIAGNEVYFTGTGATQDATVQRTTYADAGVTAPANGESYALKLSHTSHYYPTFQLNFGKTLEAGTTVTFDVYGSFDGWASGNDMNIEFTGDSGSGQVVYMLPEAWFTATIVLNKDCDHLQFFWNIERGNGISGDVASYILIDNVKAALPGTEPETTEPETTEPETTEPETTQPTPAGSFRDGVDFEQAQDADFFGPVGGSNEWRDATLSVVSYANAGVSAPENGGASALKLTSSNSYWPTLRISFGETLPAGTVITFDAYTRDITNAAVSTVTIFEYVSGGEATAQYYYGSWNKQSITLASDCDHLDLVCTLDRWEKTSAVTNVEVYLDNFRTEVPVTVSGNILDGYGFEIAGNELNFAGIGASQDAAIQRTTYADAGVPAPANAGSYALKLSHTSHYYPTFQMNFGRTLEAGTTVTFDVYGSFQGWTSGKDMNIEFTGDSGSGQVVYMLPEAWFTATIVLNKDCDHLQFFWNIERNNGISGDVASYILIDNVKAVLPGTEPEPTEPETTEPETTEPETTQPTPAGSFRDGVDFEQAQDADFFGPVGGSNEWRDAVLSVVSYADAGMSAPENGGASGLKLTSANSYWPTLRISFGETLPAGTVITFDAYTRDITNSQVVTVSIFEYVSGGEATAQYYYGSWNKQSITLASDCDHLDLVCTLDRWEKTSAVTNVEVYLDNFRTEVPVTVSGNILDGYGFEIAGNELYYTGIGASQDAAIQRTTYADAGVTAPANAGSYALKLSHTSHYYPTFQMNFGKTLEAGTTVTFDVYGSFQGWTSGKDMNIEFTGDSGSGQVVYMLPETWFTATIVLNKNCDHLQFFWNIERNNGISGDVASYILIDNVKAVRPSTEPEPAEGFRNGVTFEQPQDTAYFGPVGGSNAWRDATLSVVSYADAGVSAPENGGASALKLTSTNSYWPTLRISFGETLPAGTTITFDAYTRDITDSQVVTVSIFEYVSGGEATAQYYYGSWNKQTITLASACDHVDLLCTLDRWEKTSNVTNVEVFMDNFTVTAPVASLAKALTRQMIPGMLPEKADIDKLLLAEE